MIKYDLTRGKFANGAFGTQFYAKFQRFVFCLKLDDMTPWFKVLNSILITITVEDRCFRNTLRQWND